MEDTASEKPRLYYSISEVSELLDVKQHVLRYWETQFPNLRPKKNRAGNRMYRPKDIDTLRAIKELLYDRRYTIAGAKRRLARPNDPLPEAMAPEGEPVEAVEPEIEFLAPNPREVLRGVREEVLSLRNWLQAAERKSGPPSPTPEASAEFPIAESPPAL